MRVYVLCWNSYSKTLKEKKNLLLRSLPREDLNKVVWGVVVLMIFNYPIIKMSIQTPFCEILVYKKWWLLARDNEHMISDLKHITLNLLECPL